MSLEHLLTVSVAEVCIHCSHPLVNHFEKYIIKPIQLFEGLLFFLCKKVNR